MTPAGGRSRRRAVRDGLVLHALVALGAALGGVGRAAVSLAAIEIAGGGFPWGTLAVNVVGSFLIGFYATLTGPGGRVFARAPARQFVMTGFCGGFTTFSIFSLETLSLAEAGALGLAGANLGGSLVAWMAAVWAGHSLATRLNRLGGR